MALRVASVTRLRNRNRNTNTNTNTNTNRASFHQQPPKADQHRSRPWYAVFIFAIPVQVELLQLNFYDSSPFQTHPANMWTFVFAILFFCITLAYYIKCWLIGFICFMNICDKVGYISGLLATTAFISILVPPSFEPFVFVIWMVISIMFIEVIRNWILKMAQKLYHFAKDAISYVHNIWKRIIRNNDNVRATIELV